MDKTNHCWLSVGNRKLTAASRVKVQCFVDASIHLIAFPQINEIFFHGFCVDDVWLCTLTILSVCCLWSWPCFPAVSNVKAFMRWVGCIIYISQWQKEEINWIKKMYFQQLQKFHVLKQMPTHLLSNRGEMCWFSLSLVLHLEPEPCSTLLLTCWVMWSMCRPLRPAEWLFKWD